MKSPFGKKDNSEASYKKYQNFRKEVESAVETIKKISDRKERLVAYEVFSANLHGLYGDKPQLINSKTATWAAGGGALAGASVTMAVATSFILLPYSVPTLIAFGAVATASGAVGIGGIGGVVGNFKELRKQRKEHGSVENAREIHRIIGLVDDEIRKEKSSLSTQERDELLTKQFNNIANQSKPQPVAEVPAPKAEDAAPKVETPAEATPAEVKELKQKRQLGYDKISSFNNKFKNKKGPQQ